MSAGPRRSFGWRSAILVMLLSSAWLSAGTIQDPADEAALRRDALARFDVVPLREGIALAGRTRDRRVEIVDGLVLAEGVPLSGRELRTRLGADADLVLKLSYLTNDELKRLFASGTGAGTPRVPPAPPTPSAPPVRLTEPPPPAPPIATTQTPPPPSTGERVYRRTGARVGLGKSVTVAEDEEVTEAVVAVLGSVTVAGRVRDDVVAVGGSVTVLPTADIRGEITAVGGTVTIAPGAKHSGRVHSVATGDWGWSWPQIAWSRITMDPATRWLSLAGTLTRVVLLALIVGAIVLFAHTRVGRVSAAVASTPVRAALVGVGAQLLFIPVLVVVAISMAATIVGLPLIAVVIPLALVAMFAAMLLGIASLAQTLGRVVADRFGWHADATAWALGLTVVVLPTVLSRLIGVGPNLGGLATVLLGLGTFVEYLSWTVGLGAALMTGLGRWSTAPPPIPGQMPVTS